MENNTEVRLLFRVTTEGGGLEDDDSDMMDLVKNIEIVSVNHVNYAKVYKNHQLTET